jgi:phospholipase C
VWGRPADVQLGPWLWGLEPLTKRSRDNLPNPKYNNRDSVYVPVNSPAIGDLFDFFNFAQ